MGVWTRAVVVVALLGASMGARGADGAETRTVADWASALTRPGVEGPGVDAAGRSIEVGHLRIKLASGRLYPVRAGGELVGAWFVGTGSFRHAPTDRYEAVVRARQVERASDYRVGADGSVTDAVSEALIVVSKGAEALTGGASGAAPPSGSAAVAEAPSPSVPAPATAAAPTAPAATGGEGQRSLEAHLTRWERDWMLRYDARIAQARVEGFELPVTVVEMKAGKHDVLYVHDPSVDGTELLGVMKEAEYQGIPVLKDRRYCTDLSVTPTRADRLEPPALRFVVTDLDVDLRNPEGAKAELTVKETIEARTRLKVAELRLASHWYVNTGVTAHIASVPYVLASVKDAAGKALPFVHRNDGLLVELPKALEKGEKAVLTLALSGDVLYRPGGDSYWMLQDDWYPVPREWAGEAFHYHAVVRTPKPFVPFSNGKVVRRFEEDGLAGAEFLEEKPIQAAVILAGKYTTYEETRDGQTVRVSSYAIPKEDAKKKVAGLVLGFIKAYEPLLGKYPFGEVDVIEINSYGWGQAPAGMIFVTKEVFEPLQARGFDTSGASYEENTTGDRSEGALRGSVQVLHWDTNARLAHEVAHGWWGHVAMLSVPEDEWLSESVAEYYSAFCMGALRGKSEFDRKLAGWKSDAHEVEGKGSIYLANSIDGDDALLHRRNLLYARGPLVLHALRKEVGDDPFFTIMKSYLTSFPMKPASTKNFIALTNFVTKKDLRPWFDRYFFGMETPPTK